MAQASWTYQVPEAGAGATALEDYAVEAAGGELVGRVVTVVRRDGDLYLVVNRGTPPLTSDLRAVPWEDVAEIDHSALVVRLALDRAAIEESLELDPDNAVEGEEAEAVRVTELPSSLTPPSSPSPNAPGPVDRLTYGAALATAALGFVLLLGIVVAASLTEFGWEFALFALPGLLLAIVGCLALRVYRAPYER